MDFNLIIAMRGVAHDFERGVVVAVAAVLSVVVTLAPKWASARLRYSRILFYLHRKRAALREAQAAVELSPNSPDAVRLYGVLLFARRRFWEAAGQFRRWAELRPGEAEAFLSAARAFRRANRPTECLSALRRAVHIDFSLWRGHLIMAQLAEADGNDWWAEVHLANARRRSERLSGQVSPRRISAVLGTLSDLCVEAVDQILVCRALILRDLRLKYRQNALGIALEFMRPVAIDVAHYYYFMETGRPVPGHQYAVFTISGFAVWFVFSAGMHAAQSGGKWPSGATHFPGVTRMHLRVAAAAWAFFINLLFAFGWVLPLMAYGADLRFPAITLTVTIYVLTIAMGFGYGLMLDGVGRRWPMFIPFFEIANWMMFITSGVYDSLSLMPRIMSEYIWYNPLIHLAEFSRQAYWSAYPVAMVNMYYPAWWTAGFLALGILVNRCLRQADLK